MGYLKHLFLAIALLIGLGSGLNLIIDPFDVFNTPRLERINTHKSIGVERLSKPLQAISRRPNTIVLGTSRCLHGIDPKDIPGGSSYNLSLPGALAGELEALSRHVAVTTAKHLILCLNFVSFNEARSLREGFYADVLGEYGLLRSLPRTVFSYAALKRSRNTLRDSLRGKPTTYRADGFRPFAPRAGKENGSMISPVASFLSPGGAYRDFPGFAAKLTGFELLFRDLRTAGVLLTVMVPPLHAAQLEAINEAGLWSMFEDWKRNLAALCEATQTACWDFAGFSPMTTESLTKPPSNFGDTSHFRPSVGRLILRRVFNPPEDEDFGVRLTPGAIDAHLAAIRADRETYRRDHLDDVQAVRDIAISYGLRRADQKSDK
ncbi:MAG TPA: hypothetical protein DC046_12335 [Rhodospirillaceae bacterium]|nr:hypothetical protein [Rhodospirillaceae bacterium]